MGFWDDLARAGAAFATGGASEMARAVYENEIAKQEPQQSSKSAGSSLAGQQMAAGQAGQTHHTGPSTPAGCDEPGAASADSPREWPASCCARYTFAAPFLVDTHSGRVWRYDETHNRLDIVERAATPVEKSVEAVMATKLALDAAESANDPRRQATVNEHRQLDDLLKAHVAAVEAHAASLRS